MPKRTFTDTWLKAAARKPPARPTAYSEPGRAGLLLRHQPGGAMSWVLRYQLDGRVKWLTLGSYPAISLEGAHEEHAAMRKLLAGGIDPAAERERQARVLKVQQRRDREVSGITVRNVIAEWGWHYARRERKRPREAVRLLKSYLAPWKGRPVAELRRRDAVLLLDRITARNAPVAANRVRDLAAQAFTFCIGRDLIENNPFLAVTKPGGSEKSKQRALSTDEIRTFWAALDKPETRISPTVRAALRLILATAQRPGEVMGATWSEMQLDGKAPVWRIPPERIKTAKKAAHGTPHEVPLSDLAVELLEELRAHQRKQPRPCIAPSVHSKLKPDEPLSERALSRALKNNHKHDKLFGLLPFTPHDLRRTAATLMSASGTPRLHVAKVLNHSDRGVTAIYDRHDYLPEKRTALQAWSADLRAIITGKSRKVVPIKHSGRA